MDDFAGVRKALLEFFSDAAARGRGGEGIYGRREEALAALDRIEARLKAAEMLAAYVSGVLCDAASIPVADTDDLRGLHKGLRQLLAERDEALADAERLTEALRPFVIRTGGAHDTVFHAAREALAAHEEER